MAKRRAGRRSFSAGPEVVKPAGPLLTYDEVAYLAVHLADKDGVPREMPLGCGIAESNLRTDARRPEDSADDERYWPDVSMGWQQQTVRWSEEYRDWYRAHHRRAGSFPGTKVVSDIGDLYYDPVYAGEVAMRTRLTPYYRDFIGRGMSRDDAVFAAVCKYNFAEGDGRPANGANGANYRRGIAQAKTWLVEHGLA